jgi:hypothetical protein
MAADLQPAAQPAVTAGRGDEELGKHTEKSGSLMNTVLKAGCLAIYLLAVVGAVVALPFGITPTLQKVAVILLAVHVLELLVAFKSVRRHPGPLVDSIALTLLFGFMHWKSLTRSS